LEHGLKKGDELDIRVEGNKLIISVDGEGKKRSKIELNITDLDKDSIVFLIRGLYIRGYDEIKLIFDKPLTKHYRTNKNVRFLSVIHNETLRSTGLEIIQEKSNLVVLRRISESTTREFDTILRRIFLLLIDAAKDLYEGVKARDFELVKSLEEKHDTMTKFIFYNLRLLNTMSHIHHAKAPFLFHIIASLDMVNDTLRNAARDILESGMKPSHKGLLILEQIYKSIELYYNLYYNFNLKRCNEFSKVRDSVLNIIKDNMKNKLTKEDVFILTTCEYCLEILRNLYSARVGMEY